MAEEKTEPATATAEPEKEWEVTTERFVAFFDIMGFKERISTHTHDQVLEDLKTIKQLLIKIENLKFSFDQDKKGNAKIKAAIFSDSVVFFSIDDSVSSLSLISLSACFLLSHCFIKNIPIKGALSFGKTSVDIENSIFFGKSIVNAYLLQEELALYGAVLDHSVENKMQEYGLNNNKWTISDIFIKEKIPFKNGSINHYTLNWCSIINDYKNAEKLAIENLDTMFSNMYLNVSGKPRIYLDNTYEYFKRNYKPQKETK